MPEPDPTATSNRTAQTRRPRRGTAQGGFRADIQALRAIAVAGVVLYHLWPHRLPGGFVGVDVFFVISGYLITSHLLKRPPRTPREVAEFWARRVKRLLPASLLVLTVTALVSFKLAPVSTWQDTGKQIVASALYVQNWILSFDSVDYLAADNAPTAVQHFWSLSVEEQFYFFWPILIGLLALFVAKSRSRTKVTYLVGIGLVTGASLVYSIWMSIHEPAQAYFVTPVRLWELSAGGLVAVLFGGRKASTGQLSALCSWAGLFGIAASFMFIKGTMAFPGYIALLPVVSTALVLAAYSTSTLSPMGLMKLRGVQFTGNTSYSIYLWHWPFVVLLPTVVGNLRWWHKFGIIAAVLLLAWLTMVWVEKRFKFSRFFASTRRTFITAAVIMAVAVTSGASVQFASYAKERASQSALEQAFSDDDPCLGAEAIESNTQNPGSCPEPKKLLLDPATAKTDKAD